MQKRDSKKQNRQATTGKATAPARGQSLLIEILTEELPPKSLARLSAAFSENMFARLNQAGLLAQNSIAQPYATPRRLAVLITNVSAKQPDRMVERKGPAVSAGLDAAGAPTPALRGFAKSCGVEIGALEKRRGDKGEYFIYRAKQKGEALAKHLAGIVAASLKELPAPKLMRWGEGEAEFVRPVHGLIMLHGKKAIAGEVLGLASGRKTRGHRFLSKGIITIPEADHYADVLQKRGTVIASFAERQEHIREQLQTKAGKNEVRLSPGLLDEVTALVEYPAAYEGKFAPDFLQVPPECLIISMQQHQKYFPLYKRNGDLLPGFLFISNIKTKTPAFIIQGNERVLKARLSDAKFFFEQDKKIKLADRVPKLGNVVFHNKLGSQLQRTERIKKLALEIARVVRADQAAVETAAYLSKADLLSEMVGEFPELQGIMGYHYAKNEGISEEIAVAIKTHYYPRFAEDETPHNLTGACVALADKLDTLVGIYGIGLIPSGEKDPFGLRRHALGAVRILVEGVTQVDTTAAPRKISNAEFLGQLDILKLLNQAAASYEEGVLAKDTVNNLYFFLFERFKSYLREKGYKADEIEAVLGLNLTHIDEVLPRLIALQEFRRLPEAEALAAANKRIRNILRQAGNTAAHKLDRNLFKEEVEHNLARQVQTLDTEITPLLTSGQYTAALKRLASLRDTVDEFFDKVMVMVDDEAVRANRLALLQHLSNLFLRVADVSRLQPQSRAA